MFGALVDIQVTCINTVHNKCREKQKDESRYTDDTVGSQKVDFLMRTLWFGKRGCERVVNDCSDVIAARLIDTLSTVKGLWDRA